MSAPKAPERQPLLAFGPFLLDPAGPDLFRKGKPVRMQPRPLRALVLLASRPGELVTREELRDALWAPGHFVDFDRGLAFVLREARAALGDDGRSPKYIETLPRRGFRFLAEVERRPRTVGAADAVDAVVAAAEAEPEPEPEIAVVVPPVRPAWRTWPVAIGLAGVLAASFLAMARDRSTPPATAAEGLRVAVLPFTDAGTHRAPLAEALTEELRARLARSGVAVSGRVSSEEARARGVREAGRVLGVTHVVTGAIERNGSDLAVVISVSRTRDGSRLTEERIVADAPALDDEVVNAVTRTLGLPAHAGRRRSASAAEACRQGLSLRARGTPETLTAAIARFETVLEADPNDAEARAALADTLAQLRMRASLRPHDVYPRVEKEARAALALDPNLPEAHTALAAALLLYRWDEAGARAELQKALALDPGNGPALHDLAFLLADDEPDEAVRLARLAASRDPLSARTNTDVGWVLLRTRRDAEALVACRATLDLEPGHDGAQSCAAEALRRLGRHDEAAVLTRSVLASQGAPDDVLRAVVTDPQGAGSRAAAAFRLARLRARESRGWVSPYAIASAELAVGNEAGALVELERGLAERDPMLRRIDRDVTFETLRERKGFLALTHRGGSL